VAARTARRRARRGSTVRVRCRPPGAVRGVTRDAARARGATKAGAPAGAAALARNRGARRGSAPLAAWTPPSCFFAAAPCARSAPAAPARAARQLRRQWRAAHTRCNVQRKQTQPWVLGARDAQAAHARTCAELALLRARPDPLRDRLALRRLSGRPSTRSRSALPSERVSSASSSASCRRERTRMRSPRSRAPSASSSPSLLPAEALLQPARARGDCIARTRGPRSAEQQQPRSRKQTASAETRRARARARAHAARAAAAQSAPPATRTTARRTSLLHACVLPAKARRVPMRKM
jgi:hypothetical protein